MKFKRTAEPRKKNPDHNRDKTKLREDAHYEEETTMQYKTFARELAFDAATAYKADRLDRRSFLTLCGLLGIASLAVSAGDADAAVRCHPDAIVLGEIIPGDGVTVEVKR